MKTAVVNLTLEESGMLYHLLLMRLLEDEKAQVASALFTEKTCAAIRDRQVVLVKKLAKANDELRR